MNLEPSPITPRQWRKVLQALYYSAGSGFAGGFVLGLAGVLQASSGHIHDLNLVASLETAAVVGGIVGAFNSLAVTVKQLFTPSQ
jgi:hypothetical protein